MRPSAVRRVISRSGLHTHRVHQRRAHHGGCEQVRSPGLRVYRRERGPLRQHCSEHCKESGQQIELRCDASTGCRYARPDLTTGPAFSLRALGRMRFALGDAARTSRRYRPHVIAIPTEIGLLSEALRCMHAFNRLTPQRTGGDGRGRADIPQCRLPACLRSVQLQTW